MKRKNIIASTVGLLGISSMILGAVTLAGNTTLPAFHGMGSGQRIGIGSGQKMMAQFTNPEEAQAFRIAVESAIEKKDYTAFKDAHTKYGIDNVPTQDEFTTMIERRANQEKINTALGNGDYATRKSLSTGNPILETITTEAKFKRLQEIHSYNEKARAIAEELGLPGPKGEGMGMGMGRGMKGEGRGMGMKRTSGNNQ